MSRAWLAAIACVFPMCANAGPPDALPFAQELQDVLDNGLRTTSGTGVAAAVVVAGKREWVGVSGMSDPTAAAAVEPDMLFDIASVGKVFVATIVLQLAEEGKLTLDDRLTRWLPAFPNVDSTITIRQLLNHTSGIAHFAENSAYWTAVFGDLDSLWTPEGTLSCLPEAHFAPGAGWHYSSANYVLLGMIIERAIESTLSEELRDRLFVPLRLDHTFTSLDHGDTLSGRFAHGHFDLDGDGTLDDMGSLPRTSLFSSAWAAGPVVSTARDLARWADALYGGQVLKRESLDQMLDFHRPTPGEPLMSGYGLGTAEIRSELIGAERVWGHLGWQPGYMTAMLYLPSDSVSLTVMINDNNESCITTITVGLWGVIKSHL